MFETPIIFHKKRMLPGKESTYSPHVRVGGTRSARNIQVYMYVHAAMYQGNPFR